MDELLGKLEKQGIIFLCDSESFRVTLIKPYSRSHVYSLQCNIRNGIFEITLLNKAGVPI